MVVVDVLPVDIVVCLTLLLSYLDEDAVYLNISSNCGLIVTGAAVIFSSRNNTERVDY